MAWWARSQRGHHDVFGDLVGAAFDHQDGIARAGHAQVEVGLLELLEGRVDDELAVDPADAHGADRAAEGDVGDRQRRRGADDAQHVDRVLAVGRQGVQQDLHVVAHVLGEQGPQRAIGQPGGQDGGLGRPAFAAEERAGDAPAGVQPFLVIDGQREEIDPLALPAGSSWPRRTQRCPPGAR